MSTEVTTRSRRRFSPPPPDVRHPVGVIEPPVAAALATDPEGYVEELGDAEDPEHPTAWPPAAAVLDNEAIYRIIREVAAAWSGEAGYGAVAADPDLGLRVGLVLFPQASSHLGSVLTLMWRRDPAAYAEVFGPAAEELLATASDRDPAGRLRPVAGEPLTSAGWMERFRRAGAVAAFQAAQNEEAIERQFRPMLAVVGKLGLSTDRGLAMAYDEVVAHGFGAGLRRVVHAAGPLRTAAQRAHALAMLGSADLASFQTSAGLAASGRFGPETHAALVDALRRQGQASLPDPVELECRLVAAAEGQARERLLRLRDSAALSGAVYQLGPAG
jgi:hypothetical protein